MNPYAVKRKHYNRFKLLIVVILFTSTIALLIFYISSAKSMLQDVSVIKKYLTSSSSSSSISSRKHQVHPNHYDIIVFTTTYYDSENSIRFKECLQTLRQLSMQQITIVVIDSSPHAKIRDIMKQSGGEIRVVHSTSKGKGNAFREGVEIASSMPRSSNSTWICYQEPEKVDMARHWRSAIYHARDADILIPERSNSNFKKTYPYEQYLSENFANSYLDAVASTHSFSKQIDWHFGPVAFRNMFSQIWSTYPGDSYEVQICPIVHAIRHHLDVVSIEVPYNAPLNMKIQEEGNVAFIEKRLMQINFLDPKVKAAWNEQFYTNITKSFQ